MGPLGGVGCAAADIVLGGGGPMYCSQADMKAENRQNRRFPTGVSALGEAAVRAATTVRSGSLQSRLPYTGTFLPVGIRVIYV